MARLLVVVVLAALVHASTAVSTTATKAPQSSAIRKALRLLTSTLKKSENYKLAGSVIGSTGFAKALAVAMSKNNGLKFTLFAPTDSAFEAANITSDSFPCKNDITPVLLNRYIRSTLAFHVVLGRITSTQFGAVTAPATLPTPTAVPLQKLTDTTIGALSGLNGDPYTQATLTDTDIVKSKRFVVHGIDTVLAYPTQWTGF